MCFEQLWSVGAAPPGDPEAPHTPGLPSVRCYQSFFKRTSYFPRSHSAWPQHSHLTFSVCWALGVSALSLSRLTMPQCVSCLLSLLSSASPAPHPTSLLVSAEDWGRSQPLAIPSQCPWPGQCWEYLVSPPSLGSQDLQPVATHWRPSSTQHSVQCRHHDDVILMYIHYCITFCTIFSA